MDSVPVNGVLLTNFDIRNDDGIWGFHYEVRLAVSKSLLLVICCVAGEPFLNVIAHSVMSFNYFGTLDGT